MSRQRGLQFEAFGCILIITVMLIDRYLFGLQDGFILACAVVSAITLIIGIRTVKLADEKAEEEMLRQSREETLKQIKKGDKAC